MALDLVGFVELPAHAGAGGFDHAAVHESTGLVYVAHTANDALDVLDAERATYVGSIPGLPAVAGALVGGRPGGGRGASCNPLPRGLHEAPRPSTSDANESEIVFTSNRGENTIGIFSTVKDASELPAAVDKVAVGMRPNGLAFCPRHARLLVAHVGDPAVAGSCTVSLIDVATRRRIADLPVAGRTRWAVYDPVADVFHVNVADPPQIVVIGAADPVGVRRVVTVPHAGPHGLDVDAARRRLYCACDAGVLAEIDADSGAVLAAEAIAGVPDVVFFNERLGHLYVAIGDPPLIEVFETAPLRRHQTVRTEAGAHTLSFDPARDLVCAFLPATHRAAVYRDRA